MKKLIAVVALLCIPLLASAEQPDALLTPDGTLFSVRFERAAEHPDVETASVAYLKLTARRGETVTHEIIPATTEERGGNHNPTLAYDADSGMLFVFWIRGEGLVSNQLMFTSRSANGEWAPARVFGDAYDQRKNLRIAVTRKFRDDDGDLRDGLSVHLAWWELNTTSGKGSTKYAMASIHNGGIVDFIPVDLAQFVPEGAEKVTGNVNKDFLKQPVLFTTPNQDSVILLFGDLETNTVNQVRITPRKIIADGRLRVPGGRREGGARAPGLEVNANSRIEGVYVDSGRLALYAIHDGKLRYAMLNGDQWSEPFSITLDDQLEASSAVDALRRLVTEH